MSVLGMLLVCALQTGPWPLDEWRSADTLPAGLERERARAEISYRARDFSSAETAARAGLAIAPRDLRLLQLQCGSALWLADGATAADALARWSAALRAEASLDPGQRRWWDERWREHSTQVDGLVAAEAARRDCAGRARWVSLSWGVVLVAAAAWLALSTQAPVATSGRDRS